MNHSSIENIQPEQMPIREPEADNIPSAQVSANAIVGRRRVRGK